MTVNDASLGESGSKLSKVAATSLLMGVTRASSEAYALPPTWFIGFMRARLWTLSASRPRSTDLLPPSALPLSLRSLRLFTPARHAAGRLPAGAGHRAAVAISAPVPHHLFHGNLPGVGALVDDEFYKVRIASHIARVSEDKFKN